MTLVYTGFLQVFDNCRHGMSCAHCSYRSNLVICVNPTTPDGLNCLFSFRALGLGLSVSLLRTAAHMSGISFGDTLVPIIE